MRQQSLPSTPFRLAILPGMADLYNRLWPGELIEQVAGLTQKVSAHFNDDGIDVETYDVICTREQCVAACERIADANIDLLIVALAPYCPSGVFVPALEKLDVPFVLWPMGTLSSLEPDRYDLDTIKLNHGVHAVQDIANVLHRSAVNFGVMHGYWEDRLFLDRLHQWACAGRALKSIRSAKPVQIGGHFKEMMDLQISGDCFMSDLGVTPHIETIDSFVKRLETITEKNGLIERYKEVFAISDAVTADLLRKTACCEAALRQLLSEHNSRACGINFLTLCNDIRIANAMHLPASMLMLDGYGYAAEGDWVTAAFVYAMQQAFGAATFSEMFSVGYANNKIVLRHWGEGNPSMARSKPMMLKSEFKDRVDVEFPITSFEFVPGEVSLINLSATKGEQGQLISIPGCITEDSLPNTDGPRAVFEPASSNVIDLLNDYAFHGGSHHLALVKGNAASVVEKLGILTGWEYTSL